MERAFTLGLVAVVFYTSRKRLWRWIRSGKDPDELDGIVSDSSRVIAAWRAVEALEKQPLFVDAYALTLAGEEAFRKALKASGAFSPAPGAQLTRNADRKRALSNVAARVWWFDHRIGQALRLADGPRQVVVLGAGMDTRPWRMDLPEGVAWFEVDQPDVVRAKRRALELIGAEMVGEGGIGPDVPGAGSDEGSGGAGAGELPPPPPPPPGVSAMPLRASSWAILSADLREETWGAALAAEGYDPSLDTLWILEGILMYLSPSDARALLSSMRAMCGHGSALVTHNVTEEFLTAVASGALTSYPPFTWDLVKSWEFGLPTDPGRLLAACGWDVQEAMSRAAIAHEIFGADNDVDLEGTSQFETVVGSNADAWSIFVAARAA